MSFVHFDPSLSETFSLVMNPAREYSSGTFGVTGSVGVFPRRSPSEKEVRPSPAFVDSFVRDQDLGQLLDTVRQTAASGALNITGSLNAYMSGVNAQGASARKSHSVNIVRLEPGVTFSKDFMRKSLVRTLLMPHYRTTRPDYQYAYTNYHALNFFTSSQVPSSAALLYPNVPSGSNGLYASGTYVLTGGWTFDFRINPRYAQTSSSEPFRAGTLFHLSSCYAVSLVSGSARDINGIASGYRVLLQLSHSADVPPSSLSLGSLPGTYPRDLAFVSDDNVLSRNTWHHVAIRWGGTERDSGTGSFIVDGVEAGRFVIPSSSVAPLPFVSSANPDVLFVGNYCTGPNRTTSSLAYFFDSGASTAEGVTDLMSTDTGLPASSTLTHPLNAEVHELRIFGSYRTMDEIVSGSRRGPADLSGLRFYVPPFFTGESPLRTVLKTPFASISSTTDDPINVALSFGVDGHLINVANFTRDMATLRWPRHFHMTASTVEGTVSEAMTANEFLYATASVRRANLLLLPCDDGLFSPNFELLTSGALSGQALSGSQFSWMTNDLDSIDSSLISLTDMIPTGSVRTAVTGESGSMFSSVAGASPDSPGLDPGDVLTVFQRTRDSSSNAVTLFDVSNIFYGQRIMPGSVSIEDGALTGSGGAVRIGLRDDARGSLYRANSSSPHATWNSVGNVFYEDGLILIKSPHLYGLGRDGFRMTFKGEHAVHTLKLFAVAPAGMINSSSNPSYVPISASNDANDADGKFVYITGLNFHDRDMNVVMRTALAQPAVKRHGDRLAFAVKVDF